MSDDLAARVQRLEDRAAISEIIIRYANALDSCDYVEMRSLLTDEVLMDFDFMSIPPTTFDADAWCGFAEQALSKLKCTHHMSANHVFLHIDETSATVRTAMYAGHWLPNDRGSDEYLMRGHYINEAVRGDDGVWRIAKMKQITTWATGNSQMFDFVMAETGPTVTPRRR